MPCGTSWLTQIFPVRDLGKKREQIFPVGDLGKEGERSVSEFGSIL